MQTSPEITLYPASKLRILAAYFIDAILALAGGYGVSQLIAPEEEARYWALIAVAILSISATQGLILSQRGARTIGRRMMGLIVVSANGLKLSFLRRWLRFPLACLSWGFGGLGILWVLIDPMHRSWHDILTGTVEVPRLIRVKTDRPQG